MGFIGGNIGYRLLRSISPQVPASANDKNDSYPGSKLESLFGPAVWELVQGKTVLDFGCGPGGQVLELLAHGAERVIGLEIQAKDLTAARKAAQTAGVTDRCVFATTTDEKADVIFSLDAFEHFSDPSAILREMRRLLKDDGQVLISFGPTWLHPLGGHLFSVFPWAHLLFTENALIRWRSDFIHDGATRFGEVAGGLNQMTIRRFQQLVAASDFRCDSFELIAIKKFTPLVNPLTREFFTSLVRCRLIPR